MGTCKRLKVLLVCLVLLANVGLPNDYPPQTPKGPNGPKEAK